MLIKQDGSIIGSVGGSILEEEVRKVAKTVIQEETPRIFHFDCSEKEEKGMICGGDAQVYIEPIIPMPTLYIFGGGHIALPLARLGKMLSFRVVVLDDREEYANPERFSEADKTIAGDFTKTLSQLSVDNFSYLVIVTRGHSFDQTVLAWAAPTSAHYIGMIGSAKKIKTIFDNLRSQGISDSELKRVHAPIGLSINAETPEEIAISIMAEIISVHRSGKSKKEPGCIL